MASLRSISSEDRTDMSSISVPTTEDKPIVDEIAEQAEVSGEASDAFKSQFRGMPGACPTNPPSHPPSTVVPLY
jgi:hypothetical protein